MSTAYSLPFDEDPSVGPTDRTLAVRATSARPLSRKEQAFNRLLAKVQALRSRLDEEKRRLDLALVFHAAEVRPRMQRATALRKDLVRTLTPFIDDRRLKAGDRRVLATLVADQLDDILMHDEAPDQELRELFEKLHGMAYAEAAQQEVEGVRSEMAAVFAELGLDVDVPDLRVGMSEEEIAATAAEMMDQLRRSTEAHVQGRPEHRPSKREQRAEERRRRFEEMQKAGIATVYRRLAKALHPDLERDADLRTRKSTLMQEVTAAYARRDLHTLLRLELEWIDGEQADPARRGDETLSVYTELLKQQITELEAECVELPLHPRYQSLVAAGGPFGQLVVLDGPAEVRRLDLVIEGLGVALERMITGNAWQEVRGAIREYREAQRVERRRHRY